MPVWVKKTTLRQYKSLKERSEDLHSEGLNAKAQMTLSLTIIFSFCLFYFLQGIHHYTKKKKKELLIAYFSFILCPLSELKYELYENRSSVYTDC